MNDLMRIRDQIAALNEQLTQAKRVTFCSIADELAREGGEYTAREISDRYDFDDPAYVSRVLSDCHFNQQMFHSCDDYKPWIGKKMIRHKKRTSKQYAALNPDGTVNLNDVVTVTKNAYHYSFGE